MSDPGGIRRYAYEGGAVTYEAALCRHAAECVHGLPEVFDTAKRPWIQPGNAPAAEVERVVARCPTRALKIARAGVAGVVAGATDDEGPA